MPRLPFVAGGKPGRIKPTLPIGIPHNAYARSIRRKIYNSVSAELAQQPPWPHEWTAQERDQLRYFYIAALRDICGAKSDPEDAREPTTLDRDARLGRALWASLGAWPWSLFGPKGERPAAQWWLDDSVCTAWHQWLSM